MKQFDFNNEKFMPESLTSYYQIMIYPYALQKNVEKSARKLLTPD
jgi:hypothetical protein